MWKAAARWIGWVMVLAATVGCRGSGSLSDRMANWWRSPQDPEYRLLLQSIDEYARKNGLSREQAIRQLREQADQYALQQRQQRALFAQQSGGSGQQEAFSSYQAGSSTQQGYSPPWPSGNQQGGITQSPASIQQGPFHTHKPSARSLQGKQAGSGVNQTSWASVPDQEEKNVPMGHKPSSSILR